MSILNIYEYKFLCLYKVEELNYTILWLPYFAF